MRILLSIQEICSPHRSKTAHRVLFLLMGLALQQDQAVLPTLIKGKYRPQERITWEFALSTQIWMVCCSALAYRTLSQPYDTIEKILEGIFTSMTSYQALFFDLDGTLTDPKAGITKSIQYALAQFGIDEPDLDKLIPFIGPPLTESFQIHYGFDATQAQQALDFYRVYFTAGGMYENVVYDGIVDLLATLNTRGKRLFVATSKPTVFAEQILTHFHLDHYFEGIIGSNLDGTRSAKTEVIAHIFAQTPTLAHQTTAMVGDRKHDIIGAQNNDIDAIAVGYGYGTRDELEAARPTHLAMSVADLARLLQDTTEQASILS